MDGNKNLNTGRWLLRSTMRTFVEKKYNGMIMMVKKK